MASQYYKLGEDRGKISKGADLNGVGPERGQADGQRRFPVSAFALLPFPLGRVFQQRGSISGAANRPAH